MPKATTTRAVDVTPVLSLERVREPGDVLAVPMVIADLAVLAQVFLAERALNPLIPVEQNAVSCNTQYSSF